MAHSLAPSHRPPRTRITHGLFFPDPRATSVRPCTTFLAAAHRLIHKCSARAHTHTPPHTSPPLSHMRVCTHTYFQSLPHTITFLPLSLTNTPSAKRVALLQSSPRSVCHCSPSRPPWPRALPFHLQTRRLGPRVLRSFLCYSTIIHRVSI